MQNQSHVAEVEDLGLCDYATAWQRQQQVHAQVLAGDRPNTILLVEHPTVVTLGKNARPEHLLVTSAILESAGIALVETDRGGEVTGHEPGQLVVYPILRLTDYRLSPRKYVCLLEKSVIATLAKFGVRGQIDPEYPGVWVGQRKVCAIGIRIKQRISMHGIALNVCNDLRVFESMVPCGISGRSVTSMSSLTRDHLTTAGVKEEFLKIFLESLRKTVIGEVALPCQDGFDPV